jgi:hypothetical protein
MDNVKIVADKSELVAIADAVRNKTGNSKKMTMNQIVDEINGIEIGGS